MENDKDARQIQIDDCKAELVERFTDVVNNSSNKKELVGKLLDIVETTIFDFIL